MGSVIVFVLFVVLGVGAYYLSAVNQRRRREATAAIAANHGLFFTPHDPYHMADTLPFELFDRGRKKSVANVMYGTLSDGRQVRGFEYQYTEGSGKNAHTYRWSCGMAAVAADWPHLTLGPETFMSRVEQLITGDDIDFESDEFNKAWEIRCDDRRFASAMIDPEMMLFLMDKAVGTHLEVAGGWVLYFTERQTPEYLTTAIARAREFCERVPPVVWSLYPAASPS